MKDYTIKEYITHLLIGTPLQQPAQYLRTMMNSRQRWQHPELQEIYMESSRINKMMERMIQDSMNCIDVGCHLGSVLNKILQLSPHGNHIAIEPILYKAEWLRRKFPKVNIHQIALSDTLHEATFHYYPLKSGFSGLCRKARMNDERSFQVQCERLDDIVPANRHIDYIKVDVEGGELDVFRGANDLLQRCQPHILFECTRDGLASFDVMPNEIFNFLTQQHSYSIFLIKDWLNNKEPLDFEKFSHAIQYPFQAFNFVATKLK